jgi:hypothetical protein
MLAKKSLIASTARYTGHGKPQKYSVEDRRLKRGCEVSGGNRLFAGSTWVSIIPCNPASTRDKCPSHVFTL